MKYVISDIRFLADDRLFDTGTLLLGFYSDAVTFLCVRKVLKIVF